MEKVFVVTVVVTDDEARNDLSLIIESAVTKATGYEASVDEEAPEGTDGGGNSKKPRAKTPEETADTQDWQDANTEEEKFSEKRSVLVAETKVVSKYMKQKNLEREILEAVAKFSDENLPIELKRASAKAKEAWKVDHCTEQALIRRANDEYGQ